MEQERELAKATSQRMNSQQLRERIEGGEIRTEEELQSEVTGRHLGDEAYGDFRRLWAQEKPDYSGVPKMLAETLGYPAHADPQGRKREELQARIERQPERLREVYEGLLQVATDLPHMTGPLVRVFMQAQKQLEAADFSLAEMGRSLAPMMGRMVKAAQQPGADVKKVGEAAEEEVDEVVSQAENRRAIEGPIEVNGEIDTAKHSVIEDYGYWGAGAVAEAVQKHGGSYQAALQGVF